MSECGVIVLLGHFFLRVFDVCFGVWDVEGMVSDVVVVVSRTELILVGKGEKIDMVDEESALLDDDNATEVHRLLDVEEVVSIKRIGEDSDDVVTAIDVMDGKRCARVEVDGLVTVGIFEDILGFGTDVNGCNNSVSLRGHRREVPPADLQERAHSCHPSSVKRGPKGTQRYPQDTIFLLTGEAWAKRKAKASPEHHFPPYGTPHTANVRVGKPTVLVEHK
ncbi:hypothetical protein TNCV_3983321 [Trichonephila clavipes]|nr:hypothetical protein TNCV_3983321 [Trichonephila clavipes]